VGTEKLLGATVRGMALNGDALSVYDSSRVLGKALAYGQANNMLILKPSIARGELTNVSREKECHLYSDIIPPIYFIIPILFNLLNSR
jgi:hypothetical protein